MTRSTFSKRHKKTFVKSLITASIVWPILICVNHFNELLAGRFDVFLSPSSALTFIVPFMVSFISRVTETRG